MGWGRCFQCHFWWMLNIRSLDFSTSHNVQLFTRQSYISHFRKKIPSLFSISGASIKKRTREHVEESLWNVSVAWHSQWMDWMERAFNLKDKRDRKMCFIYLHINAQSASVVIDIDKSIISSNLWYIAMRTCMTSSIRRHSAQHECLLWLAVL